MLYFNIGGTIIFGKFSIHFLRYILLFSLKFREIFIISKSNDPISTYKFIILYKYYIYDKFRLKKGNLMRSKYVMYYKKKNNKYH